MKKRLVISLLSMLYLSVLAQPDGEISHQYRIGDIICRNNIGNFDIGESCDSCIWDFRNIKTYDSCLATEFTSDCERKDAVAGIYNNMRHYYSQDYTSIYDVGFESNNIKVEYDRAKPVLLLPLVYGKMKRGVFHGSQMYCEKLFGRLFGTYSIEIDGKGKLLLPDGKVLEKAYRVHCITETGLIVYDDIHSKAELLDYITKTHPFTADSISSFVSNCNDIRHDEVYKWYAEGYRYPIVEVKSYGYGETPCKTSVAYYCSPDEQSKLYDLENESIRKTIEKVHVQENNMNSTSDSFSYTDFLPYTIESNGNTFVIRVNKSTGKARVDAVLSDVSGIVLRSASGDTNSPIVLNCSGLRNGEYAIRVIIDGLVYENKVCYANK